jgi:hypothetical protein
LNLVPSVYDAAWRWVRGKRKHRALTDELLWHKVYERYIRTLPKVGPDAGKLELIEAHLRIVPDIAGRIAWRRCPYSFGIWANEAKPTLSHVGLVYELTAMGNLGLLIAADRFDRESGWAFSTYANYWIKKLIRLYLEELVSIVPRNDPERRAMDVFNAAIERRRQYRGKAAGGMAAFDSGITIPGPKPGDKEIEVVGTEGITNPERLDYLQRRVGKWLFPWEDTGAHFKPRLALKGHSNSGGRAYDTPAEAEVYELEEVGEYADPGVPVTLNDFPCWWAEVCYLPLNYFRQRWHKPTYTEESYEAATVQRQDEFQAA